jgi:hypothetical protein
MTAKAALFIPSGMDGAAFAFFLSAEERSET